MKAVSSSVRVHQGLYDLLGRICKSRRVTREDVFEHLVLLKRTFQPKNDCLLKERDALQDRIDTHFSSFDHPLPAKDVVQFLQDIGYICKKDSIDTIKHDVPDEIFPMAGPQLVVPADKVNMVLNAANARWGSLYQAIYGSNLINAKDEAIRHQEAIHYVIEFLNQILPLCDATWEEVNAISIKDSGIFLKAGERDVSFMNEGCFAGVTSKDSILCKHNQLGVELVLDNKGGIHDVILESALSYIIDLEDASMSTPESKIEAYRILFGIAEGDLFCEVRGQMRALYSDDHYVDTEGQVCVLPRRSCPLVRDVGAHIYADKALIIIDDEAISEKILDCYLTSLCGHRLHVAPKMHGAQEVAYHVELLAEIDRLQHLPTRANKIGIMNEEVRTNAQIGACVDVASDIVFFTNTGFLDYTGSFIDLMMQQGAIAPYRDLSSKIYKSSYEIHNVYESLRRDVPQIGAGMWPKIRDMKGLMVSKEEQIKGLADTGWSPSPMAATIHAVAFHVHGDVRQMQRQYIKEAQAVPLDDLFSFPSLDKNTITSEEILESLDFATHGLLAYAEPWIRRGIGCSGIQDLSGELLMEDRATARIKAAFVRNWLLHGVISCDDINASLQRMAKKIDGQHRDMRGYTSLLQEGDEVMQGVRDVIYNPDSFTHSYVEPYFYAANRRYNA